MLFKDVIEIDAEYASHKVKRLSGIYASFAIREDGSVPRHHETQTSCANKRETYAPITFAGDRKTYCNKRVDQTLP